MCIHFDLLGVEVIQPNRMCEFKGKQYPPGKDFYDDCIQYCQCKPDATVHCEKIECPQQFGLDVFDPGCLEWDHNLNYKAEPPRFVFSLPTFLYLSFF